MIRGREEWNLERRNPDPMDERNRQRSLQLETPRISGVALRLGLGESLSEKEVGGRTVRTGASSVSLDTHWPHDDPNSKGRSWINELLIGNQSYRGVFRGNDRTSRFMG